MSTKSQISKISFPLGGSDAVIAPDYHSFGSALYNGALYKIQPSSVTARNGNKPNSSLVAVAHRNEIISALEGLNNTESLLPTIEIFNRSEKRQQKSPDTKIQLSSGMAIYQTYDKKSLAAAAGINLLHIFVEAAKSTYSEVRVKADFFDEQVSILLGGTIGQACNETHYPKDVLLTKELAKMIIATYTNAKFENAYVYHLRYRYIPLAISSYPKFTTETMPYFWDISIGSDSNIYKQKIQTGREELKLVENFTKTYEVNNLLFKPELISAEELAVIEKLISSHGLRLDAPNYAP